MSFTFFYVTCSNKKEANKIALHLLNKKLIACANIFPIESLYWWKEKIEKSKEFVLIVKTSNKKFKKVETEIKKIHSYSIPCIIKFNVKANKEYENWIKKSLSQ